MITIDELTAMLIVPVLVFCMCVGWAYKHLTSADNKYIPVVLMILGGVLACIYFQKLDIITIGAGFVTGIASCGCYDLLDNLTRGASNGVREAIEMSDTEALEFIEDNPELFDDTADVLIDEE